MNDEIMCTSALVAIDGSAQSDFALTQFLKMINTENTKLTVLYVVAPSRYITIEEAPGYTGTLAFREMRERLVKQEEERIRQRIKEISKEEGVEIEMMVRIGDPRDEILSVAKEINVSLIVMGSTGKGLGGRILLGSVSTYISTHSEISTMIIR
jgi:nucleotide-binding universal stress UspA family protein